MLRSTEDNKQAKNAGFSLVELIIVVSILAIAAIPLMKSMSMATKTNATAQSIQNATSLAERYMEEVKSSDIEALATAHGGFSGGVCTYIIPTPSPTPVAGENYTVTVTIDKNAYSTPVPPGSTSRSDKVKAANVLKLPKIEEIDTLSQAVLSSDKEFNRYDESAQSYFNEKKADYDPAVPSTKAEITSKKIDIVKSNAKGAYNGVTVKATVTYEDSSGKTFVRELYTGSFVQDAGKWIDSNIYIFYRKGSISGITETISITDNSNYSNADPNNHDPYRYKDSHKVYFIRQDPGDDVGPTLKFNEEANTFTYATLTPTPTPTGTPTAVPTYPAPTPVEGQFVDGAARFGNIYLITNLGNNPAHSSGHVYREEEATRVYEITVVLTDPRGRESARVHSTVTADD